MRVKFQRVNFSNLALHLCRSALRGLDPTKVKQCQETREMTKSLEFRIYLRSSVRVFFFFLFPNTFGLVLDQFHSELSRHKARLEKFTRKSSLLMIHLGPTIIYSKILPVLLSKIGLLCPPLLCPSAETGSHQLRFNCRSSGFFLSKYIPMQYFFLLTCHLPCIEFSQITQTPPRSFLVSPSFDNLSNHSTCMHHIALSSCIAFLVQNHRTANAIMYILLHCIAPFSLQIQMHIVLHFVLRCICIVANAIMS